MYNDRNKHGQTCLERSPLEGQAVRIYHFSIDENFILSLLSMQTELNRKADLCGKTTFLLTSRMVFPDRLHCIRYFTQCMWHASILTRATHDYLLLQSTGKQTLAYSYLTYSFLFSSVTFISFPPGAHNSRIRSHVNVFM